MHQAVSEAAAEARAGKGPTLIEARMYRLTPHSSDDDDRTYRSREEVEEHKKKDPLVVARRILEEAGLINQAKVDELEQRVKEMVDDAVQFAEKSDYPDGADALFPVYAEEVQRG